ncbi:PAS domain S-box protein [Autumnicola psychrophila]|uniref:histidine kinase n=1 Tax=Autumnicola psychrophila TaxID=3075592 RepID=A0ABU3DQN1_9FLAO|nr:PAS domain S-box protein [Zunongwangia sp. F225]MDT0686028.1 PAS domain S-box protein [Zunongwangia sp. F225]
MKNSINDVNLPKKKSAEEISRAKSIVNILKEPVVVVDEDGSIIQANSEFYSTFQLQRKEGFEVGLRDIPFFQELNEVLENKQLRKQGIIDLKISLELPNEVKKNFLVNAGLLDPQGNSSDSILISFNEVNVKPIGKRNEKNDLQEIYEIFSQAPAIISVLRGPNHVFELANENYLQLIGNRSIIGKPVREALPEVENQGFFEILDNVYNSGETYTGSEVAIKLYVGKQELKNSFVDFVYQPILNDLNEVSGIFVHAVDVTEKVTARKKLEDSENELRKLIDTVPAIIWITRPDGQNHYLNKNWFEYSGQTESESADFGWLKAVHPDDEKRVRETFMKANINKEDFTISFRLRNWEGTYRWVLDSGSPNYSADGEYEGMVGTVVDVHEEKVKEQLIKEKEHRIRSVIEEADVATALYTGREMKIEIANDAMIELWGKDHSVVGKTLREALPELEGQPFHGLLQGVYETGETYWGKEDPADLLIDNKLQTGFFNFTYKALRDERGEIYGILNMAMDVTETVKSRELLKESESRFKQLADLMPEKVANTDAHGNFIYFNQGWLDYTGFTGEELIGKGWTNFIHPNEKEEYLKSWRNSLDSGKDFEMEFRYLNKKNRYKWHLSRAEAIKDESGNIQMWICTATEIQKIKLEEKRKEDFLKMVSHELKTPITSIKGYVQLLLSLLKKEKEEEISGKPYEMYLERVDHQINRLTRLISEMLDLSRIEKNKLDLQKETFNLNNLIIETVQDINYTNTGHNIHITEDYNCNVYGDKDRIGQVLINLVTNAVKYSPFNPEIEVKINKVRDNKVSVSVTDFGIGIRKENQKKIFKRFYRVDGNNEETYSGFGIGLYLANEIIQRHSGSLKVKSEMDEGSVFTFTLYEALEV